MVEFKVQRTALIDGDSIAYTAAAWAHSAQADLFDLLGRVSAMAQDWQRRAFCSSAIVCLSAPREDNWRRDHYPLYKVHRTADPPAMLEDAKEALSQEFRTIRIPRLEADDILGILATNARVENPVVVGVDKDLLQIPGWHLNPAKDDFPHPVTKDEADYAFYLQWLTGDSSDGFKGLEGVGPKKAMDILPPPDRFSLYDPDALQAIVARAYAGHKAGYDRAYCEAMARCARILRASDWDSGPKRCPIPWTLPDAVVDAVWKDGQERENG